MLMQSGQEIRLLLQLRDFIKTATYASSTQLARELGLDPSALQPMLDFWVKKGVIQPLQEKTTCEKRCIQCKTPEIVYVMCA